MKAASWHGRKDVRVGDHPEPEVAQGKVIIKVACCGICGTDLHEYAAGPIFIPADTPHPQTGVTAPVILGHEFSGDVVETGPGVSSVRVGDRVCVEPIIACGDCPACAAGSYNLCERIAFHGISSPDGGAFAEYTMADERMVYPIPDGMGYELASLVEPAAMVVHAVRRSDFRIGDAVAVFGAGPIGMLLIQMLRAAGASEIIAVEVSSARREYSRKIGADHTINPLECNAAAAIRELTSGGVAVAFEASGAPEALAGAIACTRYDGQTVVVSVWEGGANIEPNALVFQERSLIGILGNCGTFPETIALIDRGTLAVGDLITSDILLDDIVPKGFEALLGSKEQVKILVRP